jgi:hypothetical protein
MGLGSCGIGDIQQRSQAVHMPQVTVETYPDISAWRLLKCLDAL